ncbi:putative transcriptional regulatory protein C139,03 OS=Schizosaccharomyces pombe (strain 972 / ATCC 24843) GN=SPAC139.03 PE=4 SV=1 [Rhizoctonia solani AG-1 IB]|uniref:Putative transcriptional regulatory protein C139,03 n=1 Tax=Thanatephorus cucumeris (strain AG1-IB / isolate 7/3/14) TaxID=1108050 RepID=A0A0B7FAM5_THACB|nr:putative transcriptional regulatory protein C139,03 OS=Schizosaccharomyces pombe (strain 972 / ATCC 24843) GN=SPAC139.03 PE=4 SV=1 [Rhizoctonia solani AG-1 IB]
MDNKDGIVHEPQRDDQPDVKAAAAAAGIRSRITVVCAECKRLKLKCDRRSPCSSCVKRETTARCVYSAAAAEKIDVQSLHNRVSALEESWKAWTNTQPGQVPSVPGPGCGSSSSTHPPPPPPSSALIATTSPSEDLASALVGLDDVSSLWATHLSVNLASLSLRPSTPESDDDDEDEPEGVRRAKQIHMSSRMGVTLSHIALLPPRYIRSYLWNAAQLIIGPHAGLSQRTRTRFERMCTDIEGDKSEKWPLSLFAVGTAGLAIGAQVVSESGMSLPHSPAPSSSTSSASPLPNPPCHRTLYTLSNRSLSPSAHDTDAVLAALLHAAQGTLDGRARVKPSVWPDVCRAVGVARAMGLGLGIQKGAVQHDVEEWRVRVWWEVYCADLFTSDYIGVPPSIDDTTFSASLPSQTEPSDSGTEGENLDGVAYFFHKCRLAQLIKSLKRRILDERPLQLESAMSIERTITDFTKELPPEYRLDMSLSAPSPGHMSDEETVLQIQRCELSSLANSLILKTYYPFLKRGESSTNFATPHQASLACSSAAHSLIIASTTAHRFLPRTRPYRFAQQLFGGAVVAGSVAISSPTNMLSQIALKDVKDALSVLRELDMFGHGYVLVSKAEGAMGVSGAGVKRKREGEGLGLGFELPYVGASVVTTDDQPAQQDHTHAHTHTHPDPPLPPPTITALPSLNIPPPPPPPPPQHPIPTIPTISPIQPPTPQSDLPKRTHDTKPPAKASPYPKIGVRIRNKPSKTTVAKSRAGSERSGASPVTSVGAGMSPPGVSTPGIQASGMQGGNGMQTGAGGMQPPAGNGMQPSANGMQPGANGMQASANGMQSGTNGMPPSALQPGTLPLQSPSSLQPAQNPLQPHLLPDQPQPYNEYQSYPEPYYNNYYGGYDYNITPEGEQVQRQGQDWYRQQQQPQQQGQWNAGFEVPWVAQSRNQ